MTKRIAVFCLAYLAAGMVSAAWDVGFNRQTPFKRSGTTYFIETPVRNMEIRDSSTLEIPNSATLDTDDCEVDSQFGRVFVDTNAATGALFYVCEGTSGWKSQGGGGSGDITAASNVEWTGDHTFLTESTVTFRSTTTFKANTALGDITDAETFMEFYKTNAGQAGIKFHDAGAKEATMIYDGSENFSIRTTNGGAIYFAPNGSNVHAMLSATPFRTGFGDNSPEAVMEISLDGQTSEEAFMISSDDANDGDLMIMEAAGDVGLGITDPTHLLHVAGDAIVTSSLTVQDGLYVGATHIPATFTVMVPISAASFAGTVSSGAAAIETGQTPTNKVNFDYMKLDENTTQYFEFSYSLPDGYDGSTVTFSAVWTSTESSGGIALVLQALSLSNDEALDTAYGAGITVTDTLLAASDVHVTAESTALTIAGAPAAKDYIVWRGYRDVDHASDTLDGYVFLMELRIRFTRSSYAD